MRKFILRSSDGKSYELEGKAALQSRMIDDGSPEDVIPVPSPGDILDMVVVYCQRQAELDLSSPSQSCTWSLGFIDKLDRPTLSRHLLAAAYLNIDSLQAVICQSMSDQIQCVFQNYPLFRERAWKSSVGSSASLSLAGKVNSTATGETIDMGPRRFLAVCHWEDEQSTYKVKKIVDRLNNCHLPPSDVVDVVVRPPPLSQSFMKSSLRGDFQLAEEFLGSNASDYPWELDAQLIVKSGIPWVILGCSNARLLDGESNEILGKKVACSRRHGLKVIACVGETMKEREAFRTMDVVTAQARAIAEHVSKWEEIVLAYTPSGHAVTSYQAQEVLAGLRMWLRDNLSPEVASATRLVYGGSLGDANWEELIRQPDVDGVYVGGAMLELFIDIIKLVEKKG
ncbi:hypothetical protein MLD38_001451 [Melastoma candidum]|uniref:Uncharacterized protein n=1 Tax=Melastoma candidum TaxID=119954 RepID=A0ACB9SDQ5_9MYRT|nr:hypothetical protein MLD38_001451 [Melastoma candidum]